MIARVWRGIIRAEHVQAYINYIQATGGSEYKRTSGNQGAWTMSRIDGDRAEIIALSFWDSRKAIVGSPALTSNTRSSTPKTNATSWRPLPSRTTR